jgi:lipoyl(octanoyl) transferase
MRNLGASMDAAVAVRTQLEWRVAEGPVPYPEAVAFMEERAAQVRAGTAPQTVWLLEHPPLYTAGTSAKPEDLIDRDGLPVYASGRGGQYTYHGPGQRVAYAMLDLRPRGADVRRFVRDLEEWVIRALSRFDVKGERREGRVGIWVVRRESGFGAGEDKIAAIGVRLRHWISFHGVSLNVDPDLSHYAGIVPCGIREHGVTSLARFGVHVSMNEVDRALRDSFADVFGM